jgi:hypothetical protein
MCGVVAHADIMPNFSSVPVGWNTDRYDPHSFTDVGLFAARNDVLGIEINSAEGIANRPAAYQSAFYNTQGKQHAISGGAGSSISADLYVPLTWGDSGNGNERSDMWGVINDPTAGADPHQYPIIGFTNYGGAARYRVWDEDTANGWVDLATPVTYDSWTAFSILYTGTSYDFSINGTTVYTDSTIGGAAGGNGFNAVIMQAYNFYDTGAAPGATAVDYTAHWSNAAPVPEPSTWMLFGTMGLAVIGVMRRRAAKK